MHHVAVPLDHHHVREFDGAVLGNAPHVVAAQVDQHDVFGTLLRVGQQLVGQRRSSCVGRAAAAGAGERPDGHLAVDDADHDLGRTADERDVGRAQVEHEGAGVHDPQRAIDLERMEPERGTCSRWLMTT